MGFNLWKGDLAENITISRMRIGMYKTGIEYLLRKYTEQFPINLSQIKFVCIQLFYITNFVAINPFGRQDSLEVTYEYEEKN